MLKPVSTFEELAAFEWRIPARYNIGIDVCDRHLASRTTALIVEREDGGKERYSFADLKQMSDRLANAFLAVGVRRGARVAVLLPQSLETGLAHLAALKAGLVSVPLSTQFGADALRYRLQDCGAAIVVTDRSGLEKLAALRTSLPQLREIFTTDGAGAHDLHAALAQADPHFEAVDTAAEDPAVIIYTSGTTGNPKGALLAHRTLLGHLPGVELPHHFLPQSGDVFWTPADWAWIGGLFDVLLPAWHHGLTVVARRFAKFDARRAMALMAEHKVRNVFVPPTVLKLMRQSDVRADGVALRSIASGGESLGGEILDWAQSTFGIAINEFYGQTECNVVVGNDARLFPVRPGAMGRAIPGHQVAVVDDQGRELPRNRRGNIAIRRPDPVMFLEYWNNPEATRRKFVGDWLITGDQGRQDDDGYFWYVGRDDDLINSAGYRIGPGEIEECLLRHASVANAAVVGAPDPIRSEVVVAFVVLKEGQLPGDGLRAELQAHVRARLAAYEYPRHLFFVEQLPLTTTGKIVRRALRDEALERLSGAADP